MEADENLAVEALGELGNCTNNASSSASSSSSSSFAWYCSKCSKGLASQDELLEHVKSCEDKELQYSCQYCPKHFSSRIGLESHMRTHKEYCNTEYQCNVCHLWFQRLSSLKNHEKIHNYKSNKKNLVSRCEVSVNNVEKDVSINRDENTNHIPPFETLKAGSSSNGVVETVNEWRASSILKQDVNNVEANSTLIISAIEHVDIKTDIEGNEFILPEYQEANNVEPSDAPAEPVDLFVSQSELKDRPYSCPFCKISFSREKALYSHLRFHDDNFEPTLICQKCDAIFDSVKILNEHLGLCNIVKQENADDDNGVPDFIDDDTEEPDDEDKDAHYFPPKSERSSRSHALFRPTYKHVCSKCDKSFKTRQKLFRHVWIHRTREFRCEHCETPFPTIAKLNDHRRKFHKPDTPFVCNQCGKGYASKQGMTDHLRSHSGWVSDLVCSYCNKSFSSRQGYTIHLRIHTGERPYKCGYCTKSFRDGGTLRKHEYTHTGERPYKCPICQKAFNQKVVLREHVRGVHVGAENKNLICLICGITKSDPDALSQHLVKHSDELRPNIVNKTNYRGYIRTPRKKLLLPNKKAAPIVTTVPSKQTKKTEHLTRKSQRTRKPHKRITRTLKQRIPNRNVKKRKTKTKEKPVKTNKSAEVEQSNTGEMEFDVKSEPIDTFSDEMFTDDTVMDDTENIQDVNDGAEAGGGIIIYCDICNERFTNRKDLLKHIFVHI